MFENHVSVYAGRRGDAGQERGVELTPPTLSKGAGSSWSSQGPSRKGGDAGTLGRT